MDNSPLKVTDVDTCTVDHQLCGNESGSSELKVGSCQHDADIHTIDVCCDQPNNNHEQSFLGYGRTQTNIHQMGPASVTLAKHH